MGDYNDVVDISEPMPSDINLNAKLVGTLQSYHIFESEEGARRRLSVLGKLGGLFRDWTSRVIAKKPGMNEAMAQSACGKIFTFGSYRLGVHGPGTDMDLLCVAPRNITREDYEHDLYAVLKRQPSVTQITGVFTAKVPLIKMVFDEVPIDLLFASLEGVDRVGDDLDLQDDQLIERCDEKTILSLNGPRNTDRTIELVPKLDNFRMTLRAVRLWAKRRGLYSNVLGYPGGAAWSILVAKICKMYPNFIPSQLVRKFFKVYSELWDWNQPVFLVQVNQMSVSNPDPGPMVVMTPAFPSFNSTHSVSKNTKKAISDEMYLANKVAQAIEEGHAEWRDLFEPVDFFNQFSKFLRIDILAKTSKDLEEWHGFVLSKMRVLYEFIDKLRPSPYLRPLPNEYEVQDPGFPDSLALYNGIKFLKQPDVTEVQSVDFNVPFEQFAKLMLKERKHANVNLRLKYLQRESIEPSLLRPEHTIRKRYRSIDAEDDPLKKQVVEDNSLAADVMADPVIINIAQPSPVPSSQDVSKKKFKINFKKK